VSANLKEYHAKTRENIQQLFNWVEAIERALPVARSELWSEGEENFEARLTRFLPSASSFQSWTSPIRGVLPPRGGQRLELLEQAFW